MRRMALIGLFGSILLVGCGQPVRVGIEAARAAQGHAPASYSETRPEGPGVARPLAAFTPEPRGGGAAITASEVPQARSAAQIVGLVLDNDTGSSMPARAVRFGQVFVPGQLPSGSQLIATGADGALPTQMDIKTTNPDGSTRFAVVTVIAGPMAAGRSLPLMLTRGSGPASAAIPLARLSADAVAVDIAMHDGARHHIEAGQSIARAIADGKASVWRQGPVVTEARVDVPVEGSLHVIFDVAAEATGGLSTDVEVCNDYAMQPVGGTVNYDVAISQSGKEVVRQGDIRQLQYTTWHKVVRSDGSEDPHIVRDPAYVLRTGALPNYDLANGVDSNFLAGETRQMQGDGFGILGNAGLVLFMGTTGGRPDIGPISAGNAAWLITQERRAERYALAQADAAGSIPWHYDDVAHGRVLNLDDYPTIWSDPRGLTIAPKVGLPQPVYPADKNGGQVELYSKCNCFSLDAAHQPDLSFVPYLMTGRRYYLDQLVFQAAWSAIAVAPGVRQNAKALVATFGDGQVRSHAWLLREIDNAAYILPDKHPLKAYFVRLRDNNYTYIESRIPELTRQEGEAYGYDATLGKDGVIAPWQQEYLALAIGQAAAQGYEPAQRVMRWMDHFLATRFLVAASGFDPHDAVSYQIRVAPSESASPDQLFKTWAEIAHGTDALGYATHGQWTKLTFRASMQEALASLATAINVTGDEAARKAYAWLRENGPGEEFARQSPQFSITPRSGASAGTQSAVPHPPSGTPHPGPTG